MVRPRVAIWALVALVAGAVALAPLHGGVKTADAAGIAFETPTIVDPIHTNGEPDIGIDNKGRVFASGPTGTGTQRSTSSRNRPSHSSWHSTPTPAVDTRWIRM